MRQWLAMAIQAGDDLRKAALNEKRPDLKFPSGERQEFLSNLYRHEVLVQATFPVNQYRTMTRKRW